MIFDEKLFCCDNFGRDGTVELFYLQLCLGALLLTIGAFLLTIGAFLLTVEAFLLTVGKFL